MSSTPAKFIFDIDMSHPREHQVNLGRDDFQAQLTAAREEGRATGFAEGEQSEASRAAQALTAAADRIAAHAAQTSVQIDENRKKVLAESIELARSIATKIASTVLERLPSAELETLIRESLTALDHAPHLVIHCHEDLAEAIKEIAETRIAASGFSGRLIVMGEPDMDRSDGRLEWVDGGVGRDKAAIEREIEKRIQTYFDEQGIVPDQGPEE